MVSERVDFYSHCWKEVAKGWYSVCGRCQPQLLCAFTLGPGDTKKVLEECAHWHQFTHSVWKLLVLFFLWLVYRRIPLLTRTISMSYVSTKRHQRCVEAMSPEQTWSLVSRLGATIWSYLCSAWTRKRLTLWTPSVVAIKQELERCAQYATETEVTFTTRFSPKQLFVHPFEPHLQ